MQNGHTASDGFLSLGKFILFTSHVKALAVLVSLLTFCPINILNFSWPGSCLSLFHLKESFNEIEAETDFHCFCSVPIKCLSVRAYKKKNTYS